MSETLILHHLVIFNMLIKVPCGNRVLNMLHQASANSLSFNTARSVHARSYMCIIIIVYVLYCVINFVLVLHTAIRPRQPRYNAVTIYVAPCCINIGCLLIQAVKLIVLCMACLENKYRMTQLSNVICCSMNYVCIIDNPHF